MELLGHVNIEISAIYTHIKDDELKEAVGKLEGTQRDGSLVITTKKQKAPQGGPDWPYYLRGFSFSGAAFRCQGTILCHFFLPDAG